MSYNPGVLLYGKLAVVTGGGSGIGRAVAQLFAKHGASVVVADVNKKNAEDTVNGLAVDPIKHAAVHADISNADFVEQFMEHVVKTYDRPPAILVNCAGITKDRSLQKMSEQEWDWVLSVNLKGPFLLTQAVAKAMVQHKVKNGSIINISSIVGKQGAFGQANYAASKAGLIGLTKTVAIELGKHNIRCNAIMPGYIQTPMTDALPQNVADMVKMLTPLGRVGQPEEIANACLFLASGLSSFMTGATLEVTGGFGM